MLRQRWYGGRVAETISFMMLAMYHLGYFYCLAIKFSLTTCACILVSTMYLQEDANDLSEADVSHWVASNDQLRLPHVAVDGAVSAPFSSHGVIRKTVSANIPVLHMYDPHVFFGIL